MSARPSALARIATLIRLDARLAWEHKLVHVTVIVAAVFGALIGFALPAQIDYGGTDYVFDASEGGRFAKLTDALAPELVLTSEEAVREAVIEDGRSIGVVFRGRPEDPGATVYVQGNESPERLALIQTGTDAMWQHVGMDGAWTGPTVLEPDAVKPPFNELMLTVIYTLDLCLLGFMFGSVMILQDKEQGTIRAYRVGPGSSLDYVASKLTVNLGLSALNLTILTGLGAPRALAEPALWVVALSVCAGMTLMGMALSVFLRNIAQWFFPLVAVSLIGTTPVYLMFTPTAALAWTWWIPTYHMLFGSEAAIFAGDAEVLRGSLGFGLVFAALMASACLVAVERRLLREVH